MGKLRRHRVILFFAVFLFDLKILNRSLHFKVLWALQRIPQLFETKGSSYVLSALKMNIFVILKMNNPLFLIALFGCSLKPVLGNISLTEPSLKPCKIFKIGLLAGSSSLHTLIFKFLLITHNTWNKQERYYFRRHKRAICSLKNVPICDLFLLISTDLLNWLSVIYRRTCVRPDTHDWRDWNDLHF